MVLTVNFFTWSIATTSQKVKIEMLKRGLTQTQLARKLGLSLPYLNMVIHGKRKTFWIQMAIAKELGAKREDLFLDYTRE
jgi:transcriptional regulator with XRE-family HTH domain